MLHREGSSCRILPQLRMALYVVLREVQNAVNLCGPDCSSWGIPARGTSKRSPINPLGCQFYEFVKRGNCMVSRPLGLINWMQV